MAFKAQELMVHVLSGRMGAVIDPASTCMTRTINSSFVCCEDPSAFADRSRTAPQGQLDLLRHQLRAIAARA
jgi:hypothetical protein